MCWDYGWAKATKAPHIGWGYSPRSVTEVSTMSASSAPMGLLGSPTPSKRLWPGATVHTCVVHLIRNSIKYCGYHHRRALTRALRPIYTAPTIDAALEALNTFDIEWGARYPAIVGTWRRSWERFIPFLSFPPAIRKIIYTTNAIESMNYQLPKVTKTSGHVPSEDAVLKIFYLAICNIGHHRSGELGTATQGWKEALNVFAITFPGRINLTNN